MAEYVPFLQRWRHRLGAGRDQLRLWWAIGQRYIALSYQIWQAEGSTRLAQRILRRLFPQPVELRRTVSTLPATALATNWYPLQIKGSSQPRISVIIPVHNQHRYTFNCLRSIATVGAETTFEIIVVDDRSSDETATMLAAIAGIRTAVAPTGAEGFVAACNAGAAVARGELLLFLNNDTLVTPGWLDHIVATFAQQPKAGLVGARLVYPDGRLQEAGCILWRDASAWNYGRGDDPDKPEYNYLRRVDYCSGACLAVPAGLFTELGGFSPEFAPAYYEDADLALKIKAAGYEAWYQPAATIMHFEGASAGRKRTQALKQHQIFNQRTLQAKWAAVLDQHDVNGVQPERVKDRGVRGRVLVVDAAIPTPDRDSGSLRMSSVLEIFCELGFKVSFAATTLEHGGEYGRRLQQIGVEVLYRPYTDSLAVYLRTWGAQLDVVVLSRANVAAQYMPLVRRHAPTARLIFDTVDLHFLREARFAQLRGSGLLDTAATVRERQELELIRQADVTLVVSPVERDLLRQRLPDQPVELVSNIVVPRGLGPNFTERRGIVFIGSFNHPPNIDAVVYLCTEIVPQVQSYIADLKVWVIGVDPPQKIQRLASAVVEIAGQVADLEPYLDRCLLTVAPLRYGAGVKGKINTSMAYGVPVVATPVAAEGMNLTHGHDVLIADSAADFAQAVIRLHQDPVLWEQLAVNGLDNLHLHFSPTAARLGLCQAVDLTGARH